MGTAFEKRESEDVTRTKLNPVASAYARWQPYLNCDCNRQAATPSKRCRFAQVHNIRVLAFSYFSEQSDHGRRIAKIGKENVGRILFQLLNTVCP